MKVKTFFFIAVVVVVAALCVCLLPFPRMFDLTMDAVEILPNGDAVAADTLSVSGCIKDYLVRPDAIQFTSVTVMGKTASRASRHMPELPLRTDTTESGYYKTNTSFYLIEDGAVVNVDIAFDNGLTWWVMQMTDQLDTAKVIVASVSGDFSTPLQIWASSEPSTVAPTAAPTAAPTEAPKLDEEMVRAAIDHYFAQRKDFLMGTSENIAIANLPMVTDEAAHRAAMETGEATLTDSTVEIVLVECGDTMAEAEVTETVVFEINGETVRESVRHRIYLFVHEDGNVYVSGDGYKENTTGFVSCSYIDPEVVSQ